MTYDPASHIDSRFLRVGRDRKVVSRNERDLMRLIWRNPGIARSALTEPLELTQQSLHRIVETLHQRGMVAFTDADANRPGPRSPGLTPDRNWCLTVGISINVGAIGVCLMSFGEILELRDLPEQGEDLEGDIVMIASVMDEMLAKRGASRQKVLGVGLAVAGYKMAMPGFNAPQPLLRWSMVDLPPLLSERLGLPIWADNSANTAGLAEVSFGVGRNIRHVAYVGHNYGYGGGLIIDGRPFRGGFGNAGELSAMFSLEEGRDRPALHHLLHALRREGRPELTLTEMSRTISPDWNGVVEWIERVTPAHNRVINALCAVFDPELIVLGGELPPSLARLLVERTVFFNTPRHGARRPDPKLAVAQLTDSPSAIGAALLPLLETVL